MANWNNPTLTSNYTDFVTEVKGRDDDSARQFDPATTSATNVPTNTIRWNGSANRWEKWSGSAWNVLSSSYAINISGSSASATGNAGTATTLQTARNINGVSFNGSANINVPNLLASNGTTSLATTGVTSAVNHLATTNAAAGGAVTLTTAGTDTNIGLNITTKGAGAIVLDTGTGAGQIDLKPGASGVRIWDDDSTHYYEFVTGNRTANYTINLPAGNVTIPAGTLVPTSGTGATGSWGISVTGSAASAGSVTGTTTAAVQTAALASGTASSATFLRGDRTWASVAPPTVSEGTAYHLQKPRALPARSNTTLGEMLQTRILRTGTIRIQWRMRRTVGSSIAIISRLYKNGVAFGTERSFSTNTAVHQYYTEDVSVVAGDRISIFGRTGGTNETIAVDGFNIGLASYDGYETHTSPIIVAGAVNGTTYDTSLDTASGFSGV